MRKILWVIFAALLLSPTLMVAQDKPKGGTPIISLQGISSPAGARATIPKTQLIENCRLITNEPGTIVKSFAVSFMLPGGTLFGPYEVQGSLLPEHVKEQLRRSNQPFEAFFESIVVNYQGKDRYCNSVIVNCTP